MLCAQAIEWGKQTRKFFGGDAWAGVAHHDAQFVASGFAVRERHATAPRRVFNRVRKKIEQHLFETLPVGQHIIVLVDLLRRSEMDRTFGRHRPHQIKGLGQRLAH